MTLKEQCPFCGKQAKIESEKYLAPLHRFQWLYSCGHTSLSAKGLKEITEELESEGFKSLDGTKKAHPYQIEGISFVQSAGGNCIIADAMGLGKTIQALLWLRANKAEAFPAIVAVKAATLYQWARENATWNSDFPIFFVSSATAIIPPGFQVYLISHDLLGDRQLSSKQKSNGAKAVKFQVPEKLAALQPKTVIVDECHAFKDPDSKRSRGLMHLIQAAAPKFKILMSGTPIKNRASEYFTALNIVAPQHFPSEIAFKRRWLIQDDKGNYSRIAPWLLQRFHQETSRWILRREKHEVLKDLPPIQRTKTYVEITDPGIRAAYNQQLDLWDNATRNGEKLGTMDILGYLSKLRHITAIGKAMEHGVEMVREWLENTEPDQKICVGIHHKNVATTFLNALAEYAPISLSGSDDPKIKDQKVSEFRDNSNRRLMVANVISGGVGLNLQFCSNAILFERQWSSTDERQFEDRFHRQGQKERVVIDYVTARGTIDDFFDQIIERKRMIFGETVGEDNWSISDDSNMLMELSDLVRNSRL